MKIAFVCYTIQKKYLADSVQDEDVLLLEFLKKKGLDIHREVWTDENVNWVNYDLVLLKAPWDYHEKIEAFYNWLDKLNNLSVQLLNSFKIIKWNSDKHYLKDIADKGLNIIPTLYIEKNTSPQFLSFFQQLNTEKLIMKPCISGGAKNTIVLTSDNLSLHQKNIETLLESEAYMVQPFIKEIETAGEWSFIFFNGIYSHCVVKKPRIGDFRVQHTHGGTIHAVEPDELFIETAKHFVDHFAKGCLYTRVDGIMVNGKFLLMELELIDPFLFLSYYEKGFDNYFSALSKMIAENDLIRKSTFQKEKMVNKD